jgi:hypothetical protein
MIEGKEDDQDPGEGRMKRYKGSPGRSRKKQTE